MKKVIIVDDERAGRSLIREYLEDYPDLILLAEANNGVDAVRVINEFKPDLVFLDIQMPGLTGFDVLTRLDEIPQIIFSTAYDAYALQAFEVHAVDYLLKPYTKERFKKAVERLPASQETNSVAPLAESLMLNRTTYPERILVQHNKKLIAIELDTIYWIEAYGDYSKLHTESDNFLSNYGISILDEKLDPKHFIRVHRSSMINIKKVKEIHKYGKSYDVTLQNGTVVHVSRGYKDNLKDLMF
ncbi:LytR/AlgR family response regulator transcription factor [Leeuwenhoekiella nanhaiensis]|uniref:DNA-binding response regulator n=1 Tax=Leeuwenhoekiella nanhaiensis TaxID=1655491 RepID=A0A2G1VV78_9FLAO|nr:LytTR family DNA-binding domain-containing protein [Leeuwenhoekiella nanhaiensis]PHQ30676.1 DNA-binding response regulator [Leeuwenhoekiella nanhaiensis]